MSSIRLISGLSEIMQDEGAIDIFLVVGTIRNLIGIEVHGEVIERVGGVAEECYILRQLDIVVELDILLFFFLGVFHRREVVFKRNLVEVAVLRLHIGIDEAAGVLDIEGGVDEDGVVVVVCAFG